MAFQHALPEQQLMNQGTYGAYRRTELHQEAVRRGLIDKKDPTPPKKDLIRILENNVKVPAKEQVQPPKPVPLSEAHLPPQDRTPVDLEVPVESEAVTPTTLEAPVEDDDPFAGVDEGEASPEEAYQYLARETNVFSLKKLYAEMFPDSPAFPNKVSKVEILQNAAQILGIKGV